MPVNNPSSDSEPVEWDDVQDTPETFPPEIAGTPSEGDVIKYVSGVPTWAAP